MAYVAYLCCMCCNVICVIIGVGIGSYWEFLTIIHGGSISVETGKCSQFLAGSSLFCGVGMERLFNVAVRN